MSADYLWALLTARVNRLIPVVLPSLSVSPERRPSDARSSRQAGATPADYMPDQTHGCPSSMSQSIDKGCMPQKTSQQRRKRKQKSTLPPGERIPESNKLDNSITTTAVLDLATHAKHHCCPAPHPRRDFIVYLRANIPQRLRTLGPTAGRGRPQKPYRTPNRCRGPVGLRSCTHQLKKQPRPHLIRCVPPPVTSGATPTPKPKPHHERMAHAGEPKKERQNGPRRGTNKPCRNHAHTRTDIQKQKHARTTYVRTRARICINQAAVPAVLSCEGAWTSPLSQALLLIAAKCMSSLVLFGTTLLHACARSAARWREYSAWRPLSARKTRVYVALAAQRPAYLSNRLDQVAPVRRNCIPRIVERGVGRGRVEDLVR